MCASGEIHASSITSSAADPSVCAASPVSWGACPCVAHQESFGTARVTVFTQLASSREYLSRLDISGACEEVRRQLDQRLRRHTNRKGEVQVEWYVPRYAAVSKHKDKFERHLVDVARKSQAWAHSGGQLFGGPSHGGIGQMGPKSEGGVPAGVGLAELRLGRNWLELVLIEALAGVGGHTGSHAAPWAGGRAPGCRVRCPAE